MCASRDYVLVLKKKTRQRGTYEQSMGTTIVTVYTSGNFELHSQFQWSIAVNNDSQSGRIL